MAEAPTPRGSADSNPNQTARRRGVGALNTCGYPAFFIPRTTSRALSADWRGRSCRAGCRVACLANSASRWPVQATRDWAAHVNRPETAAELDAEPQARPPVRQAALADRDGGETGLGIEAACAGQTEGETDQRFPTPTPLCRSSPTSACHRGIAYYFAIVAPPKSESLSVASVGNLKAKSPTFRSAELIFT